MAKRFRHFPRHTTIVYGRAAWHRDGARASVYTLQDLFRPQKAKQELASTLHNNTVALSQHRERFYLHFCLLPFEGKDAKTYTHTGKFKVMNIVSTSYTLEE